MKVGDLVDYIEGWPKRVDGQEGLIIGGPQTLAGGDGEWNRWQVFWAYCNKIGWWDEFRMRVIDEAR